MTPAVQHPNTLFFTGQMPFLPPNQQRQSNKGNKFFKKTPINSDEMALTIKRIWNGTAVDREYVELEGGMGSQTEDTVSISLPKIRVFAIFH